MTIFLYLDQSKRENCMNTGKLLFRVLENFVLHWQIIVSARDFSLTWFFILCSSKLLLDRLRNYNQTFKWTFIKKLREQIMKFAHCACITFAQ